MTDTLLPDMAAYVQQVVGIAEYRLAWRDGMSPELARGLEDQLATGRALLARVKALPHQPDTGDTPVIQPMTEEFKAMVSTSSIRDAGDEPIGTQLQSIVDWYGAQAAGGIVIESLAYRITAAVKEHQELQADRSRLREALTQRNVELRMQDTSLKTLREALVQKEKELEEEKAAWLELHVERDNLKSALEQKEDAVRTLTLERGRLFDENQHLRGEIAKADLRVLDIENELVEAKSRIEVCEGHMDNLERALTESMYTEQQREEDLRLAFDAGWTDGNLTEVDTDHERARDWKNYHASIVSHAHGETP